MFSCVGRVVGSRVHGEVCVCACESVCVVKLTGIHLAPTVHPIPAGCLVVFARMQIHEDNISGGSETNTQLNLTLTHTHTWCLPGTAVAHRVTLIQRFFVQADTLTETPPPPAPPTALETLSTFTLSVSQPRQDMSYGGGGPISLPLSFVPR